VDAALSPDTTLSLDATMSPDATMSLDATMSQTNDGGNPGLLSGDWLERWSQAVADAGVLYDGPPATIEIRVSGGPDGAVTWHVVLLPDNAPRYVAGPLPDASASYDQAWDDVVAQFEGRFEPVVAFMQGSLKVKGATRPLYELFRLWADPVHRAATATSAAAR
jgi:hypothetical protein